MSYIYLFQIKKKKKHKYTPRIKNSTKDAAMDGEQLDVVTVTTCRMALTALRPQKSCLGLSANPSTPDYPAGMLNWICHLQSN